LNKSKNLDGGLLNVGFIGTVGVILLAYRLGRRSKPEAKDILDRLYQG
jgi:predicted nucleic acid-binding protein